MFRLVLPQKKGRGLVGAGAVSGACGGIMSVHTKGRVGEGM